MNKKVKLTILILLVLLLMTGCYSLNLHQQDQQSEFGYLTVRSQPQGAQVFIDGELVGTTPLRIGGVLTGLAPGEKTVKVKYQDLPVQEFEVLIKKGVETAILAEFSVEIEELTAIIKADRLHSRPQVEIIFDGRKSKGDIVEYIWDFDDGDFAYEALVSHTFSTEGEYAVGLEVLGSDGSSDYTEELITIEKELPYSTTVEVEVITPETYDISPEDLTIFSIVSGESEVDALGKSELAVGNNPTQVILAVENEYQRVALLGYVFAGEVYSSASKELTPFIAQGATPIELSSKSTALALCMLDPALVEISALKRMQIAEKVLNHQRFEDLIDKVEVSNLALFYETLGVVEISSAIIFDVLAQSTIPEIQQLLISLDDFEDFIPSGEGRPRIDPHVDQGIITVMNPTANFYGITVTDNHDEIRYDRWIDFPNWLIGKRDWQVWGLEDEVEKKYYLEDWITENTDFVRVSFDKKIRSFSELSFSPEYMGQIAPTVANFGTAAFNIIDLVASFGGLLKYEDIIQMLELIEQSSEPLKNAFDEITDLFSSLDAETSGTRYVVQRVLSWMTEQGIEVLGTFCEELLWVVLTSYLDDLVDLDNLLSMIARLNPFFTAISIVSKAVQQAPFWVGFVRDDWHPEDVLLEYKAGELQPLGATNLSVNVFQSYTLSRVGGAVVKVGDQMRITGNVLSFNHGRASFLDLKPGEYEYKVAKEGYALAEGIIDLKQAGCHQLNVLLSISDSTIVDPPLASFEIDYPSEAIFPAEVTFDATQSSADFGEIELYRWDFGDGSAVVTSKEPIITHQYQEADYHTVSLTVIDSLELGNTKQKSFLMQEADLVSLTLFIEGEGTLNLPLGENLFIRGEEVELEAYPETDFIFSRWYGKVADNFAAETSIYLDQNQEVTAVFALEDPPEDQVLRSSYQVENITFFMRLAPGLPFPKGVNDELVGQVEADYWVGERQVTYELWYLIKEWALEQGYVFLNQGRAGSRGECGQEPGSSKNEPVTMISWYDVVVFCNALSEYKGLDPVYVANDQIVRDASQKEILDQISARDSNGFRLPLADEWELAARYRGNDCADNALEYPEGSNQYWTRGNYASGARGPAWIGDSNSGVPGDELATREAAWYVENSFVEGVGYKTQVGGQKPVDGNGLFVFDMSGNVWEWCFDQYGNERVLRGGSFISTGLYLQVGKFFTYQPDSADPRDGFRLFRSAN